MQKDNDPVNHPSHYTSHPSGVEVIQITEHMNFNLGNAIKYILRAEYKGKQIQDLEKAAWYVNREIQRLQSSQNERNVEPKAPRWNGQVASGDNPYGSILINGDSENLTVWNDTDNINTFSRADHG